MSTPACGSPVRRRLPRWLPAASLCGLIAAIAASAGLGAQVRSAASAPRAVDDEASYSVYATLVEAPKGSKPTAPVLRLETVLPPPSCKGLETIAPTWKAAAQAFAAANPGPRPLVRERVSGLPFIPVPPAEIDQAVARGWDAFRATYKGAGGYVGVSAVGFDPAMTRAIVWVTYACGPSCGSREFRFYSKQGRAWREEPSPHAAACP